MNLFILDLDFEKNASYHVDKHVNKIILEATQICCTALNKHNIVTPYKSTHIHHKIVKWANLRSNFIWTINYGLTLCKEFTYRRNKQHKCEAILKDIREHYYILDPGWSAFVLAMPEDCKTNDVVESYRLYYNKHKRHLFQWSKRSIPYWIS